MRLDEDGEVLIRGRNVMRGYFNRPEANAEAFTPDGWFRRAISAADAGLPLDHGPEEDLIITASGKNVAPQNVENQPRPASLLVAGGHARRPEAVLRRPGR